MPSPNGRSNKRARLDAGPVTPFPQPMSRLLKLPQELQDEIYTLVFGATRIVFGNRPMGKIGNRRTGRVRVKQIKSPYPLALLRVCRRTYQDTSSWWIKHVLFSFETPEALLDTLTPLPMSTLTQIRHVRISGHPLRLVPVGWELDFYYSTAAVLSLLPGLCLDTLTVLGSQHPIISYAVLSSLIDWGCGFKELRYFSPTSAMLGYDENTGPTIEEEYFRKPQPVSWSAELQKRDGHDSGASVTIYRSKLAHTPGAIIHPANREPFEQNRTPDTITISESIEDKDLTTGPGETKELFVVVKRGDNANLQPTTKPYYSMKDIRYWSNRTKMTWEQIKNRVSCYPLDEEEDDAATVEVDAYHDVDEIQWPNIPNIPSY